MQDYHERASRRVDKSLITPNKDEPQQAAPIPGLYNSSGNNY